MSTIIATSNYATPFGYPNVSYLDRDSYGDNALFACIRDASGYIVIYRSTDNGTNWSTWTTVSRANVQEYAWYVDDEAYAYLAYRTYESGQDRIYVRRMDGLDHSSATVDSEKLLASATAASQGVVYTGLDLVTVSSGGMYYVTVAVGQHVGGSCGCVLFGMKIPNADYSQAYVTTSYLGSHRSWTITDTDGHVAPSITMEFSNGGAGKSTGGSPHLWLTFGRTAVYVLKLSWNGSGWTGPSSVGTPLKTGITAQDYICGRYTGNEFVVVAPNPDDTDTVLLMERNKSNSTTTLRTSQNHPQGVVRTVGVAHNTVTRDIRVFAVGTSNTYLYFCDWIRATNTWGSWGQSPLPATTLSGTAGSQWALRRTTAETTSYQVLSGHTTPNQQYTNMAITAAPATPPWYSPQSGSAADRTAVLTLQWGFVDPGDTQDGWAIQRQIGAGTLYYWRNSDTSWLTTETKNAGATLTVGFASGWGADGEVHTYKAKVWDAGGSASAYSAGLVILASTKVDPAITDPEASETITTSAVTVQWTCSEQTAYYLTLETNPGGVLTWTSGWVADAAARSLTPDLVLGDLTGWRIRLTTRNNEGLNSTEQTRDFTVDYVEPAVPTVSLSALAASGLIRVAITNPSPTGSQPALLTQELYRRVASTSVDGSLVASALNSGATVDDWTAVSGVDYAYRVLAHGVNGTSIYGSWQS